MFRFWSLALIFLAGSGVGTGALGQVNPVVLFDEDDPTGADYRDASFGFAEGGDMLTLAGPGGDKMPVVADQAFSGSTSGLLEYHHQEGGQWELLIAADGFQTKDFSDSDSLILYLNGPTSVPGLDLPRLGIEDSNGRKTSLLPLRLGGTVGLNNSRSGFLPGSTTDAALSVRYVESLPADRSRPGYPEDLLITFADEPVATSVAGIGAPAIPTHFTVETAGSGEQLAFRFRDTNGDGTLSQSGEYIEILTTESEGEERLYSTWRVELSGSAPQDVPAEGDVYLLAVDNGGLDSDPTTWQRTGFAIADFGPLGLFDITQVKTVRFVHGGVNPSLRTLWVDYVAGIEREAGGPELPDAPSDIVIEAGDESVVLRWTRTIRTGGYHVYRQADAETPFERLTENPTIEPNFVDLTAENGETYSYVVRSVGLTGLLGGDSASLEATPLAESEDVFIDFVAELAFDYFWDEANPANGLVKDRSTQTSAASIAAVGFGLSAITVGIDRGWITREEGRTRVLNTLRFFRNCPQSDATSNVCGYRGFFYHFLNMQTGHRAGTTELSTIDTALLLGGVLHAREYFSEENADEAEIRTLADAIYDRVEWDWAANRPPLVTLGWKPEQEFAICNGNLCDWRGYNEAMILYILGLGSSTHPLPDGAWDAWTASYDSDWGTFYGYTFLSFPPLFGHQYSHLWVDFRGIQDDYMRGKGIDYFENSRRATLANRAYSIDNPNSYPNYGPDEWGLTASDDPFGYRAHGAPPAQADNGTITPTAAGGSIAFTPDESRAALRNFYQSYRPRIWGKYGLVDAYNIRENWFDDVFLGIDQGPFVIMIENLRTESIWDAFMQNEDVQRGLARAGFTGSGVASEDEAEAAKELTLAAYPNPAHGQAEIHFTLPSGGEVELHVYDILGRRVATLRDGQEPAGERRVTLSTTQLGSGIYIIELRTADAVKNQKLTVLR